MSDSAPAVIGAGLTPADLYVSLADSSSRAMSDAPAADARTFRVFSRGEYYTAFGPDALFVAEELYKSQDVLRYAGKDETLPSVHISLARLNALLKDVLLERKWRVEVYAPQDKSGWVLSAQGSAGDLSAFDELLSSSAATSVTMALRVTESNGQRSCSVAFVDTLSVSPTLAVGEFPDTDAFTSLAACLAQYGPAACVLLVEPSAAEAGDAEAVASVLASASVTVLQSETARASAFRVTPDIVSGIEKLIRETDRHSCAAFLSDNKSACAAAAALLTHLNALTSRGSLVAADGSYRFAPVDLDRYMRLDAAALVALNVFPTAQDTDKTMSLAGLLNRTRTAMGTRRLLQWLRLPLLDRAAITARHDAVQVLVEQPSTLGGVRDAMRGIGDIDRLVKRLQKEVATLQDVVALYQLVARLPALLNAVKQGTEEDGEFATAAAPMRDSLKTRFLEPLSEGADLVAPFEQLVTSTIDLAAAARHEYLINPSFNEDLAALDKERRKVTTKMERTLAQVSSDLGLDDKKVKLNYAGNLGYHYRISRKDEKHLRASKLYAALETRKDGVRFTSPSMKALSEQHAEIADEYEAAQKVIVEKVLEIARGYAAIFATLSSLYADLDALASLAHVAATASPPYVRPTLLPRAGATGHGALKLVGARHPCLEVQPGVSFIANDIVLEKGVSNVQIVTGPNMGGKSTYIRTAGCIALMAQMGGFVPCSSAELSIVDGVLARVGAGDSQLKGVSTFMKEMLEAAAILKASTPDSLVIIDELGRGTSTYDGFGLAWAIAEFIAKNINAYALFATHFHELTALGESVSGVVNKHVTAHTGAGTITMLYQLKDGPCDRSFGIHVAELANFPPEVVAMARAKAQELETFGKESESFAGAKAAAEAAAAAAAAVAGGAQGAGIAMSDENKNAEGESEGEGEPDAKALLTAFLASSLGEGTAEPDTEAVAALLCKAKELNFVV